MLVHHDSRDYSVASKEAAIHARGVIESLIKRGQESAEATLNRIEQEQPVDVYYPAKKMYFGHQVQEDKDGGDRLTIDNIPLHNHATVQVAEKAGIPSAVRMAKFLSSPRHIPNFCSILKTEYANQDKVYLTRKVNGEIRGFLSDKFRRLDSRPIVSALIEQAVGFGAVPINANVLDTKVYLKLLLPKVYEPFPGEIMAFGLCFQNSDYGDGALTMKGFMYRLWCTNLAMCEDAFRQIHLGKRISDLEFTLSNQTYELDTATTVSLVKDVTRAVLSPECIEAKLAKVKESAEKEVDANGIVKQLQQQSKISKDESERIAELYNSAEIRKLPMGQTAWRLSNAISLLAQSCETARTLELEDLAGKVAGIQ